MKRQLEVSKINLVHVIPSLKTGGAEVFTVNLLQAFDKNKFNCTLLTLFAPEKNNHLLMQLVSNNIKHFSTDKHAGFSIKSIRKLRYLLRLTSPDIIHTHLYCMKYVLVAYVGKTIPPWIHTVHTMAKRELSLQDRIIAGYLYKKESLKAVAVSSVVEKSFRKYYGNSIISVIHSGVPVNLDDNQKRIFYRKNLNLPESGIIIISAARFVKDKNHIMLINAFKKLKAECPMCYLVLLGDGPLRKAAEAQVQYDRLGASVIFTGNVTDPIAYFKAADVYATTSSREGLPISLLEAMNQGLPTVSTKAGGIPEVIDHMVNGVLVDIGDVDGFASALIELVRSKNQGSFGIMAKKTITDKFSIESTAKKYEELYQRISAK